MPRICYVRHLVLMVLVCCLVCSFGCSKKKADSKANIKDDTSPFRANVDKDFAESHTNSIGIKLKLIPAGTFMMGSALSATEVAERFNTEVRFVEDEHPTHKVTISSPFYMGVTEVTQSQWQAVMGTKPWVENDGKSGPELAVGFVTFRDVQDFCKRLSEMEGKQYRLPTEAEWEYAARAGTTTTFFFGDDDKLLPDFGWSSETATSINKVGLLKPNAWGLYDTCGNMFEWCSDRYGERYFVTSSEVNPTGPAAGEDRVKKGGSWYNSARACRSAYRDSTTPMKCASDVGFRVVLVAK